MTDAGKRAEGILEEANGRWRLRFERILPHQVASVWPCLTVEAHLSAWFPTTIEGEMLAGSELTFRFRGDEMPPSTGRMIECDPPRVIDFLWGLGTDGSKEPDETRIELRPSGAVCILLFNTTYDLLGKSARDAAGWHVCLDALASHLAGDAPPPGGPEPWKQRNRMYATKFGPASATIGPPASMTDYSE